MSTLYYLKAIHYNSFRIHKNLFFFIANINYIVNRRLINVIYTTKTGLFICHLLGEQDLFSLHVIRKFLAEVHSFTSGRRCDVRYGWKLAIVNSRCLSLHVSPKRRQCLICTTQEDRKCNKKLEPLNQLS